MEELIGKRVTFKRRINDAKGKFVSHQGKEKTITATRDFYMAIMYI